MLSVITAMPARLALAIDGASATESIGCRKMTEAPLLISASIRLACTSTLF